MRDISSQIALEQAHQEVLRVSRRDQLTGLFNRNAMLEFLKAEIDRSLRYHQPMTVIMMDIDHFKRINDRYGHETGDAVLADLGRLLLCNLRQPDVAARWGGEEFLILVPSSDDQAAAQLAERLRICMRDLDAGNGQESITASFGVSRLQLDQTLDQLLYVADKALYQAKDQGRDRVVIGQA